MRHAPSESVVARWASDFNFCEIDLASGLVQVNDVQEGSQQLDSMWHLICW